MSTLSFDWETVSGTDVIAVVGIRERRLNDGALTWDQVALILGKQAILLSVNVDTDEVLVTLSHPPRGEGWCDIGVFAPLIGAPLGWCWVGTNYRGYSDSFTLAFGAALPDALEPKLTFMSEGSALVCFQMMSVG